jgi:MFS transporter, putative metabolite:H+ symporter
MATGDAADLRLRLDRLPASRYIWKLVLLISLGGCFEYYDVFLTAYIGPGLVRSGLFSSTAASFFGLNGLASFVSATFTGLFFGTLLFSFTADRLGRRFIFTGSLLWYTAATVMMAFQSTGPWVVLWRAIAGVGIGVELVTIDTYITELMPKHRRGRAFAVNQAVQFVAVPIVAFLGWLLVPRHPLGFDGWRWVVLFGSLSAIVVWLIRRAIPESPRWLIVKGRLEEAESIIEKIESRVYAESGPPVMLDSPPLAGESVGKFSDLLGAPYLRRTAMLMVFNLFQTIGYYGFASWVPTLLIAKGVTITSSLRYSFFIAVGAPLGPLLATFVADQFERKWQIVTSAVCIAVFGLLFGWQTKAFWLITCGLALTCANNWMSVAFHAYQAELFPTRIRARAVGFVYSWSRLSAIFTSFLVAFFLRDFGDGGVFAFIAVSMLAVVLSIGLFGPRTQGLSLEDIAR